MNLLIFDILQGSKWRKKIKIEESWLHTHYPDKSYQSIRAKKAVPVFDLTLLFKYCTGDSGYPSEAGQDFSASSHSIQGEYLPVLGIG